jgi:hypothetical protein
MESKEEREKRQKMKEKINGARKESFCILITELQAEKLVHGDNQH